MHILVLPSFYPSLVRPYAGVFFQEQAVALQRAGHKVGVLVAPRIRETLDHIQRYKALPDLRTATLEGTAEMPVYRMHWGWFPRVFPRITAWLHSDAGARAFARYCTEQGRPDMIHAHNTFYSGYIAAKLRAQSGIPTVLTEHSSNFLRGRIFLPGQHAVVRATLEQMDAVMAVSAPLADVLRKYAPAREITYIGNVVDTDFFSLSDAKPGDTFSFAFAAAKLRPLKRVDLLLDAFAQAFRGAPVHLRIGGGGEECAQYEALARALGITEQVEFLGVLDRAGVRDLFQRSHVVVSSSTVETFGVTLIEAMSCGKPVISTRSGGPEGFITQASGVLVPVGDAPALASAMSQMRAHYNQYDPAQIRQICVDRFSEAALVRQLEAVYTRVLN